MTMSSSFYPLVMALKDVPVLVCGASQQAYHEILRLTEAGAVVTIVAPAQEGSSAENADANAEINMNQLVLTYGSRAVWHKVEAGQFLQSAAGAFEVLKQFSFALLLSEKKSENETLASALKAQGVRFYLANKPEQSDFVLSSFLKRGHLKISVATDGLCQPLERAIIRRIEAVFVSDFDQYSLFLASFEEKMSAVKADNHEHWLELYRRLEHENSHVENFQQALSRKNFEEALRIVDNHIADIAAGRSVDAEEGASNSSFDDVLPPRQAVKGVS